MPIRKINNKKDQKRNDNVTAKILKQAELRDKLGTIEDLPLQTEYPESVLIPAAAEIKAAGSIARGLLRTVGGLTLGNVGAKDLGRIGNTIDNTLGTKVFSPTLGFIGGLGGYALGSRLTNAMIPRKVTYGPTNYRTALADDQTPTTTKDTSFELSDPITRTDIGEIIPIVKRDNFRNPDIRYGFNLDEVPKADYKYNPETGNFEVNPPTKEWVSLAEHMTTDYFMSPEYYRHLLRSGADPDLARDISEIRWANALYRRPSLFRNLGPNIYGTAENENGFPRIRYNNRKNVGASLYDFNTAANTAFHELGGHGSSLNYGSGTIVIPAEEHSILKTIYEHNAQLKPKLRPFYQAIYDGNIEEAKRLASELDDVYKTGNWEKNIKKIKENIDYMLDNQEYSARGIGSNISDHYGLKNGWNETQLRKYFTDESVDNLKRNVWGLAPFIGLDLSQIPENKHGGILKAQSGKQLIDRINNTSNANFVSRLKDPNRQVIKLGPGKIGTHLMGYVTKDDYAVVFPQIQEVNGKLRKLPIKKAIKRAIATGDTLHMSIPEAEWFTTNYKQYYTNFDKK